MLELGFTYLIELLFFQMIQNETFDIYLKAKIERGNGIIH